MLDNYTNSPDAKFAADIHAIAQSLNTMAQSLAVIAGCLARRDGIHYDTIGKPSITTPPPSTTQSSVHQPNQTNNEPMTKEDTIPLQTSIETAYGTLNSDYSLPAY